jgi:hypothetical protein
VVDLEAVAARVREVHRVVAGPYGIAFGPLTSRPPAATTDASRSTSAGSAAQHAIRFAFGAWPALSVMAMYALDGGGSVFANTFHSGAS